MQKTRCTIAGQDQNFFGFGFDEEDYHCVNLKIKLLQQISILYEDGTRIFLTDCTPGVSMWSAEIVVGLMALHADIELVCLIPYEEQSTKWPKEYRDRYFSLHELCSQSILLNTDYTSSSLIECYRYMINSCDVLLAVCDDHDTGFDNMGFMTSYAKNTNRDVIYIHPDTLAVTPAVL